MLKLARRVFSAAKKGGKQAKDKITKTQAEEQKPIIEETYDPQLDEIQLSMKEELLEVTKMDADDLMPHVKPHFPPFLYHPLISVDEKYYYPKFYSIQFDNISEKLKSQRLEDLKNFPLITNDGYYINLGLLITRSPIFVNFEQQDLDYFYYKYKFFESCGLTVKAHKDLVAGADEESQFKLLPQPEQLKIKQLKELTKRLQPGFHIEEEDYTVNSKHFLFVNPRCTDPSRLEAFGAYRTYLLVKNKDTKKWQFPIIQMHGDFSFTYFKKQILKQYFQKSIKCEEIDLEPTHIEVDNFDQARQKINVRTYEHDL